MVAEAAAIFPAAEGGLLPLIPKDVRSRAGIQRGAQEFAASGGPGVAELVHGGGLCFGSLGVVGGLGQLLQAGDGGEQGGIGDVRSGGGEIFHREITLGEDGMDFSGEGVVGSGQAGGEFLGRGEVVEGIEDLVDLADLGSGDVAGDEAVGHLELLHVGRVDFAAIGAGLLRDAVA